jgi:hypothetical protein
MLDAALLAFTSRAAAGIHDPAPSDSPSSRNRF